MFPTTRMRRLRENAIVRDLVRETKLHRDDLIMPLFVQEGLSGRQEIESMPGQYRYSTQELTEECKRLSDEGVKAVILFGIPEEKTEDGRNAWVQDGIIQKATRAVRKGAPDILVITDVCLCEYTSHGHCGLVKDDRILNDESIELIARTALSQVEAGAQMVAPSDMFDGRIKAVREILDDNNYEHIPIMSYAAKYASAYYGPFRDAAGSAPRFGDRRSYQMDPANALQALTEVELDIHEGADIVMVKPALAYMDVIRQVKDAFSLPTAAYNVSGEYSMIKSAAELGRIDERKVVLETLTSIKRAGADIILTYHARDVVRWMQGNA